jgi:DNA topoisomerase-3
MKERGLGTAATRAPIIEELVAKGYLARDGKSLRATPLGVALVRRVHPHVASPALTGDWEARLRRVERGELAASDLLKEVRKFVREVVQAALANGVAPRSPRPQSTVAPQPPDQARAANRRKSGGRKQGSMRPRPRRGP